MYPLSHITPAWFTKVRAMVFLICGRSDYQTPSGSLNMREYIGLSLICRIED